MKCITIIGAALLNTIISYGQQIVKIQKKGGVYEIPCSINGLQKYFIFDTGASDVSISKSFAIELMDNGLLTNYDVLGKENYRIADGTIVEGLQVNLREVTIGTKVIQNVKGSVSMSATAPLLLGQSALKDFGTYIFDYEESQIIFDSSPDYLKQYSKKPKNLPQILNIGLIPYLLEEHEINFEKLKNSLNETGFSQSEKDRILIPNSMIKEGIIKSEELYLSINNIISSSENNLPLLVLKQNFANFSICIFFPQNTNIDVLKYRLSLIQVDENGKVGSQTGLIFDKNSIEKGFYTGFIQTSNKKGAYIILKGTKI